MKPKKIVDNIKTGIVSFKALSILFYEHYQQSIQEKERLKIFSEKDAK